MISRWNACNQLFSFIESTIKSLLDDSKNIIDFTYANSQGGFSFAGLTNGTYQVWVDQCGLPTEAQQIILDNQNPNETDCNIKIKCAR